MFLILSFNHKLIIQSHNGNFVNFCSNYFKNHHLEDDFLLIEHIKIFSLLVCENWTYLLGVLLHVQTFGFVSKQVCDSSAILAFFFTWTVRVNLHAHVSEKPQ